MRIFYSVRSETVLAASEMPSHQHHHQMALASIIFASFFLAKSFLGKQKKISFLKLSPQSDDELLDKHHVSRIVFRCQRNEFNDGAVILLIDERCFSVRLFESAK